MKIVIDALGIGRPGGARTATLNTLLALGRLDVNNQYLAIVEERQPELEPFPNLKQQVVPIRQRMLMLRPGVITAVMPVVLPLVLVFICWAWGISTSISFKGNSSFRSVMGVCCMERSILFGPLSNDEVRENEATTLYSPSADRTAPMAAGGEARSMRD